MPRFFAVDNSIASLFWSERWIYLISMTDQIFTPAVTSSRQLSPRALVEGAISLEREAGSVLALQALEKMAGSHLDHPLVLLQRASLQNNIGDHAKGMSLADKVAKTKGNGINAAHVLLVLSQSLLGTGRSPNAVAAIKNLYSRHPEIYDFKLLIDTGILVVNCGEWALARDIFDRARTLRPEGAPFPWQLYAKAVISTPEGREEGARLSKEITSLITADPEAGELARLHLGLVEIFEQTGDFEQAFDNLLDGKDIRAQEADFDDSVFARHGDQMIAMMTPDWHKNLKPHQRAGEIIPVFVQGMPRSGTSLMEQILTRHEDYTSLGENGLVTTQLTAFAGSPNGRDFPARLASLGGDVLGNIAEQYLGLLERDDRPMTHGSNKLPFQFANMPFFDGIFSQGKTLIMERDPLDNILGIFRRTFRSNYYAWATDPGSIAAALAMRNRMVAHTHTLTDNLHTVSLEEMCSAPDTVLPGILSYLGLPERPVPELITPRANDQVMNTISVSQTRSGLKNPRSKAMAAYRELLPSYLRHAIREGIGEIEGL